MSAPFIIPFNHQPVNTGASSGSYTVPVGKYARLVATLNASAYVSTDSALNQSFGGSFESGSNTTSVELWLKVGDAVTVSNVPASGTVTSGVNSHIWGNGTSTAQLLVNGSVVARCNALVNGVTTTTSSSTMTFSGSASVDYHYEEYNLIS